MKQLMITMTIILMNINVWSQSKTISGTIISLEDGSTFPGVNILEKGTSNGTVSDIDGKYELITFSKAPVLVFSFIGTVSQEIPVGSKRVINVALAADFQQLSEVVVTGYGEEKLIGKIAGVATRRKMKRSSMMHCGTPRPLHDQSISVESNTESYSPIDENGFIIPKDAPLSTFSIDVDAASYSNMRRFLNNGQMAPKDAVRIEEMINYFNYDYEQPNDDQPFAVNTEISSAPWNAAHQLVHIGLQGKEIALDKLPASNLVFLLDVSGSMNAPNKLPLLKSGLKMLVHKMRPEDRVAIVVYAGAAGLVLPSTSGEEKGKILKALDDLQAGGSTAGGAGIQLAYQLAQSNFKSEGNNRIILATDGDFNVGVSSDEAMERLIKDKRESGVFLSVLGFGTGNYKDSKMETLADKGNGNYAYIDNVLEAKKVLVTEFGGTLFTIAKDVKIQVEFNPEKVQAYRLIGYENRKLAAEDFNNDKKDAGELGSGHTVTALYEIIPVGANSSFVGSVDALRYQKVDDEKKPVDHGEELMNVKLRYKSPNGTKSKLIEMPVLNEAVKFAHTSDNFKWSAAVASFGMLLRDSEFKGSLSYAQVAALAKASRGADRNGYRIEFVKLVESCELLSES